MLWEKLAQSRCRRARLSGHSSLCNYKVHRFVHHNFLFLPIKPFIIVKTKMSWGCLCRPQMLFRALPRPRKSEFFREKVDEKVFFRFSCDRKKQRTFSKSGRKVQLFLIYYENFLATILGFFVRMRPKKKF
jgi:hypothetical protein